MRGRHLVTTPSFSFLCSAQRNHCRRQTHSQAGRVGRSYSNNYCSYFRFYVSAVVILVSGVRVWGEKLPGSVLLTCWATPTTKITTTISADFRCTRIRQTPSRCLISQQQKPFRRNSKIRMSSIHMTTDPVTSSKEGRYYEVEEKFTFLSTSTTPWNTGENREDNQLPPSSESSTSRLGAAMEQIESRLRALGFVPHRNAMEMTDWYYDTIADNYDDGDEILDPRTKNKDFQPNSGSATLITRSPSTCSYILVRNDCWLRFRQTGITVQDGDWQLKKGCHDTNRHEPDGAAVVYEEIGGLEAVKMACSIISSYGSSSNTSKLSTTRIISSSSGTTVSCCPEGHQSINPDIHWESAPIVPVPSHNENIKLYPFARIFTRRMTWRRENNGVGDGGDQDRFDVIVDLDSTDFGYTVGEVEIIVRHRDDIPRARRHIRQILNELLQKGNDDEYNGGLPSPRQQPMGKLEYYLKMRRPTLYELAMQRHHGGATDLPVQQLSPKVFAPTKRIEGHNAPCDTVTHVEH